MSCFFLTHSVDICLFYVYGSTITAIVTATRHPANVLGPIVCWAKLVAYLYKVYHTTTIHGTHES